MTDIVLDVFTLYQLALALRARHVVLDSDGDVDEANAAYKSVLWMEYNPAETILALEEHPKLNDQLIVLLEARFEMISRQKSKSNDLPEAQKHYEVLWNRYELLRRLTAYDCRALIVEK
jgi:hypothetical protein